MNDRELAIARSVVYASLFDYPLTLDQLHESLIESEQSPDDVRATYLASDELRAVVDCRDGFFFPSGRGDLIAERRRRERRTRIVLDTHRRLMRLLCAVPFTRMIALSGSAAHGNLEHDGDLDLFIVTRGPHVWTVTLAVLCLAKALGQRRILCANFVLADSHLAFDQQDLFTANQAIHLKPLFGGEVLGAVVAANPFVRRFYPNALRTTPAPPEGMAAGRVTHGIKGIGELALALPAPAIEAVSRMLYGWYLRRRASSWRSPEQVQLQAECLKLHTRSHRQDVLDRFDEAMVRLEADASGLSSQKKDQIAERGARMARREAREYREYLSAE